MLSASIYEFLVGHPAIKGYVNPLSYSLQKFSQTMMISGGNYDDFRGNYDDFRGNYDDFRGNYDDFRGK